LTPAGSPAVLADPEAASVVVADDRDAVATGHVAGDVPVDAALVREEVLVDEEAGRARAVRRDPVLHRSCRRELLHRADLGIAVRPVGVDVARLVAGGVREVVLEGDALVAIRDQRSFRPPAVAAVAPLGLCPAVEQLRFGEIEDEVRIAPLVRCCPLHRRGASERDAGPATSLVLDRRDVVPAADVAEVERHGCTDTRGRLVLYLCFATLQRSVHLLQRALARRRGEAEPLLPLGARELRHRRLTGLPGCSGLLDVLPEPFQVDPFCHVVPPLWLTVPVLRRRAPPAASFRFPVVGSAANPAPDRASRFLLRQERR